LFEDEVVARASFAASFSLASDDLLNSRVSEGMLGVLVSVWFELWWGELLGLMYGLEMAFQKEMRSRRI